MNNLWLLFLTMLRVVSLPMLALWGVVAHGADISDLYEAEVPVKTQERAERIEVYPAALSQVIIKLSGDRRAPARPELAGVIADATRLVQQFSYRPLPQEGFPELEEEGYTRILGVRFDGDVLSQTLVRAGVPLWGRTRPEVMLWLAVEDRGARYILASGASAELDSYLDAASRRRGLPMLLPLMDLADQRDVSFAEVWGDFSQGILQASRRYDADAVLVGRTHRLSNGRWEARWSLYHAGERQFWQTDGNSQADALSGGVEGAADYLAAVYAQVLSASQSTVSLTVMDVDSLESYAWVLNYLRSLDAVAEVQVSEVAGSEVSFALTIRSSPEGLRKAIALNRALAQVSGAGFSGSGVVAPGRWVYRLLP